MAEAVAAPPRTDPRSLRSRIALRQALADEVLATGDLTSVTVTAVTERAGLTRRTFYSHFKDIGSLVTAVEDETIADVTALVRDLADSNLEEVFSAIDATEPAPGAVAVLQYFKDRASYLVPLLGPGGDPAFMPRIRDAVHGVVAARALHGLDHRALGAFFDYYITFAVGAECAVLVRWLTGGMRESVEAMAKIMTLLMFVRPGDLYGNVHATDILGYGCALMNDLESA